VVLGDSAKDAGLHLARRSWTFFATAAGLCALAALLLRPVLPG
jgi:hypothetical protein